MLATTWSFRHWPALLVGVPVVCLMPTSALAQESCFQRLDNGVDLSGWLHAPTNMHGPGEGWTVEDGAIVGRQTDGQQGGILVTEASYQDVEVVLEVNVNWGCDSGLFFRTTDENRAYQVTIDHVDDSAVGTIWGEAFPEQLREIPYLLTDGGNAAVLASDRHEEPIFDLALWPEIWHPTEFNEIRARIEGNPPHIQVWIADTQVMDFTETVQRNDVNASGPLAIQVHGGSRWIPDGTVAFKNIRVRDLSVACEPDSELNDAGAGGQTTTPDTAGSAGHSPAGGSGGTDPDAAAGGPQGTGNGAGSGQQPVTGGNAGLGGTSGSAGAAAGAPPSDGAAGSGTGGAQASAGGTSGQTSAGATSGASAGSPSAVGASGGAVGNDAAAAGVSAQPRDSGGGCRVQTRAVGATRRSLPSWPSGLLLAALFAARRRRPVKPELPR